MLDFLYQLDYHGMTLQVDTMKRVGDFNAKNPQPQNANMRRIFQKEILKSPLPNKIGST